MRGKAVLQAYKKYLYSESIGAMLASTEFIINIEKSTSELYDGIQ